MNRAKKVLSLVIFSAFLTAGCRRQPAAPFLPDAPAEAAASAVAGETMELKLHFIDNGHEEIERRVVPATRAMARAALLELAKGRRDGDPEGRVLPPGTRLKDIAILDGIAYVDFSREFRDNHWGGLAAELDTVYSVVNTLAEFKSVQAVQFLLEGSSIATIGAGAVDLSEPVHPEPMAPEYYAEVNAELKAAAEPELPWSAWIGREERIGFKGGFPDRVLVADTDGDGRGELIVTDDREVAVWKRQNGAFGRVWERKFASPPRALVARADGGRAPHLIIGTDEGLYVFGYDQGTYQQLAWQGIGGSLIDIVAGETTGTGRGQILALIGSGGEGAAENTAIVIWEWDGETYLLKREVSFGAYRVLAADVTGDGVDEVLAFGPDGLTVFSWQGAAYVEIAGNPSIGARHASVLAADLTGDGRAELVIRDAQSPYLYVYAWQQEALRKLWQGAHLGLTLGWELFAGTVDGQATLIASTQEPGRYALYRFQPAGSVLETVAGSGGEEILAVGDLGGGGASIVFRRLQLLSSPTKWIYVGRPGS